MAMRTYIVLGSTLGLGLLAAHGCRYSEVDSLHCGNNEGDNYCAEQFPDGSRPYCELGAGSCVSSEAQLGCVAERPADECYSPCGGRGSVLDNGECVMEEESSGSSSGETATEGSSGSSESSTTGPMPCVGNEDCPDAAAPFCEPVSGECITCDAFGAEADTACAGLDPGMPLCVGEACVQCTAEAPEACTGMTPVCDDATNTCVPCDAHDQCGEAACNLFTGACLPADAVVHVGAGQTYTTIGAAVDSFDPMTEGTLIVHAGDYLQAVSVDGGRVLAFLVNDGDKPVWDTPGANPATPQLNVLGATVLMDGLELSGNGSAMTPGLRVDGGRAWVDRSRIVNNDGGGIVTQNAGELVLRNCFVGGNVEAIVLDVQGSTAEVLYTTMGAGLGMTTGLNCDPAAIVTARNSIILSRGDNPEVMCDGIDATYTASQELLPGMGNVMLGAVSTTWFTDYNGGDFGLSAMHPAAIDTTAQWNTGDATTDIDGDLRPTADGTADYAGADVSQ